jgi:hypothetical protein
VGRRIGKIKINDLKKDTATLMITRALFENVKGIDTAVVDRLADPQSDISNLTLLSGLHQYMSDEYFNKVYESLTVASVSQNKVAININTASADVLQGLGINARMQKRSSGETNYTIY